VPFCQRRPRETATRLKTGTNRGDAPTSSRALFAKNGPHRHVLRTTCAPSSISRRARGSGRRSTMSISASRRRRCCSSSVAAVIRDTCLPGAAGNLASIRDRAGQPRGEIDASAGRCRRQTISYDHGPPRPAKMQWPGAAGHVRISFQPQAAGENTVIREGRRWPGLRLQEASSAATGADPVPSRPSRPAIATRLRISAQ